MIDQKNRSIIAYLRFIDQAIKEYHSPSVIQSVIENVEKLVLEGKKLYSLITRKILLYQRLEKKIDFPIPENRIFDYWRALAHFINNEYSKVINFFEEDENRLRGFGILGHAKRMNLYASSKFFVEGPVSFRLERIWRIIEHLDKNKKSHTEVLAELYLTLSRYSEDRNKNLAIELLRKAEKLATKNNLLHILISIYNNFAVISANQVISEMYFRKSAELAEKIGLFNRGLTAKLNLCHTLLYMGKTRFFLEELMKLRNICRIVSLPHLVAYSYELEAMYHLYNREYKEGYEDAMRALEIETKYNFEKRSLRTLVLLQIICGKIELAKETFEKNKDEFALKRRGFDFLKDMLFSKTDDEFERVWISYRDSDVTLLREEILAIFGEKIAKVDPVGFKIQLSQFESEYSENNFLLSVALVYEGYAKYYKTLGKNYKSRIYFSKAKAIYEQIGFNNAAKVISNTTEIYDFTSLANKLKHFDITKELLNFIDVSLFNYKIFENLKSIDYLTNIQSMVNFISSLIITNVPVEEILIEVFDTKTERGAKFETNVKTIPEHDIVKGNPFTIYINDSIDEYLSYTIYFCNPNLFLSNEELEKYVHIVQILEYAAVILFKTTFSRLRSLIDSLTKIYSRGYFYEQLEKEFKRAKIYKEDISVIFLDIDKFKGINDSYGHQTGDMVLREIGYILKSNARPYDIPARYGGEEFVLLLPRTSLDKAIKIAERIRKKIEQIDKFVFKVTASIGVASGSCENIDDYEDLVRLADDAMYFAKHKLGGNRVYSFWN